MVEKTRRNTGRKAKTSFCIIDAQSVKNADTAENKGYDAGKKISGIKRRIAVDTGGLPHSIHVTTANVNDRYGALDMVKAEKDGIRTAKAAYKRKGSCIRLHGGRTDEEGTKRCTLYIRKT